MRETTGAMLRGEVRNAGAIRSSVASKTFRLPGMTAPPKLGSMKYSCAICQVAHSRGVFGQAFSVFVIDRAAWSSSVLQWCSAVGRM